MREGLLLPVKLRFREGMKLAQSYTAREKCDREDRFYLKDMKLMLERRLG